MKKHLLFFFLDDFHRGAVNHVIHFIGFTMLGYGLGVKSLPLIILSPFIMELGHFYNYFRGIHREHAIKIIPGDKSYQWNTSFRYGNKNNINKNYIPFY